MCIANVFFSVCVFCTPSSGLLKKLHKVFPFRVHDLGLSLGTFCLAVGPIKLILLFKFNIPIVIYLLFVVNFVLQFCKYYLGQSQSLQQLGTSASLLAGVQPYSFVEVETGSFYITLECSGTTIHRPVWPQTHGCLTAPAP